jgi:hypothetical protein
MLAISFNGNHREDGMSVLTFIPVGNMRYVEK